MRFQAVSGWLLFVCCAAAAVDNLIGVPRHAFAEEMANPAGIQFFEREIRPIFAQHCYECHGPNKHRSGLRLDVGHAALAGADTGPVIVPGKPEESPLVAALRYESNKMPPTGPLDPGQIELIERWIAIGAPWPQSTESTNTAPRRGVISEEDRQFWSFQPLAKVVPPKIDDSGWSRNPIDQFIAQKLEQAHLHPAPPAEREQLLRRVYFDLIGMQPSAEELATYLADRSPTAYETAVDNLLASPRYGERWGRHWLDLVRYAESDGYRQDAYRPQAWRYRDYVIRSFNEDKPYDQFVREQLAGDELAPDDPDALIATGYLRHGIYEYNQRDARTQWSEMLNDVTDVTGDVFLGLGMGCARCHDHKFDPILQRDYYALQSFFAGMLPVEDAPLATPPVSARYQQAVDAWNTRTQELQNELTALERPYRDREAREAVSKFPDDIQAIYAKPVEQRTPHDQQLLYLVDRQIEWQLRAFDKAFKDSDKARRDALLAELDKLAAERPVPLPTGSIMRDVGPIAPATYIPKGREPLEAQPAFLTVLGGEPAIIPSIGDRSSGRRAALAAWLTQPDHPLTTRVIVNRVWQQHFGRGLVSTPNDFGRLGEPPSHPELLDWLAGWFVDSGWQFKRLHRLIVTSATYRQTALCDADPAALAIDPENRLLWKAATRRLDAEQIRDAALRASGELDTRASGPSVDADKPRRGIYVKVIRNDRDPLFDAFDAASAFGSVAQRNVTTTPSQSLLMINGPWLMERAAAMSARLLNTFDDDESAIIDAAYVAVLSRHPTSTELSAAQRFLTVQTERIAANSGGDVAISTAKFPGRDSQAASFVESPPQQPLVANDSPDWPNGDFTVEAYVVLKSIYPNATVRTILSQWDGDNDHPGWSLGVTSAKSNYQPRNLILQMVGDPARGGKYEVFASDLRLELNRPYYVAVSVRHADDGTGGVTFYLQDLTGDEMESTAIGHVLSGSYRAKTPLMIGQRASSKPADWHGLIDDVRLTNHALAAEELSIHADVALPDTVAFWKFEGDASGVRADWSDHHHDLQAMGVSPTRQEALVDFCHVLLNCNEFLYTD